MNGFVGNVKWFSSGNTAPSYQGNVFRSVKAHMDYLLNHDVVDASFQKEDRKRIIDELKQYQTRYDARIAGKFFMSLPNNFDLKQLPEFINQVLPSHCKFEYVVHRSINADGQENLHVHVILHPVNQETGKKLRWGKKELSQLHKNYKQALQDRGYNLVTHTDKGEEPSIHAGQRAHYLPEAQEYLAVSRELGKLEREEEQVMRELKIPEEAKEKYKKLDRKQRQTFWEIWDEAKKKLNAYPDIETGNIVLDLFILLLEWLLDDKDLDEYWKEFERQVRQSELNELKKLPPEAVLEKLGIEYKKQGDAYIFRAPYRKDTNPSCRIEFSEKHQDWHWVDFGTGAKGTYIDLLLACGYSYKQSIDLLRKVRKTLDKAEAGQRSLTLATGSVSLRQSAPPKNQTRHGEKEALKVEVKPVKEVPEVVQYIQKERGYTELPDWLNYYKVEKDGKTYTGYGTQAVNGSLHLRFLGTASFKELCIGSSSYTHIKQGNSSTCYIVEGVHDAIALWSYGVKQDDILILNGVGNAKQVLNTISNYREIIIATDNDKVGQEAAQLIAQNLKPNQKAFRLKTVTKDVDEEWRSGNRPVLQPINPDKYWER